VPNALAHLGVQGVATRALLRDADLKWVYIGCIIPDIPWILQRFVRAVFSVVRKTIYRNLVSAVCGAKGMGVFNNSLSGQISVDYGFRLRFASEHLPLIPSNASIERIQRGWIIERFEQIERLIGRVIR
jgi:hypothetical protein